jgi:hypothetical protein
MILCLYSFLEDAIKKHSVMCENAILNQQPPKMVDNTSCIARLANRALMVARQEADNSEDPQFIRDLSRAADQLQGCKEILKELFYTDFKFLPSAFVYNLLRLQFQPWLQWFTLPKESHLILETILPQEGGEMPTMR